MTAPTELRHCPVKGCPWQGTDPRACPMHADQGAAWERQHTLLPAHVVSRRSTRHRS